MRQLVRRQRAQQQRPVAPTESGRAGRPAVGARSLRKRSRTWSARLPVSTSWRSLTPIGPIVLDHRRALDGDCRRSLIVDPRPGGARPTSSLVISLRQRQPDPLPVEELHSDEVSQKVARQNRAAGSRDDPAENACGLIRVRKIVNGVRSAGMRTRIAGWSGAIKHAANRGFR